MPSSPSTFILPLRVYYEDTDAAGVVYYANYLRYFERARTEWLRALGFEQRRLAQDYDVAFVARSVSCEYLQPAVLDDALNVRTQIGSMGRAQIVFAQRILRPAAAGEQLLVTATTRVACVGAQRLKPRALPRDMYELFNRLISPGAAEQ